MDSNFEGDRIGGPSLTDLGHFDDGVSVSTG